MKHFFPVLAHCVMGLAASGAVVAEPGKPYEEIYIKGSSLVRQDEAWKVGMTVLTSQDIERIQPANMQELLRRVAGVYVNDSGTGATSIHTRGAEANYTLVLVDGVPMNDPSDSRGGSFDLNLIDPALVDNVEVLSGSATALYGPGALGGVININLKKQLDAGISAAGEYGSNDSYRLSTAAAVPLHKDLNLSLSAAHKNVGDLPSEGRLEASQLMASLAYQMNEQTHLRLTAVNIDQSAASFPEDSGGPLYAVWRNLDMRKTTVGRYSFLLDSELDNTLTLRSNISYFDQHKEESSPGVAPGFAIPPNGAETDLSRLDAALGVALKTNAYWQGYVGIEYTREKGDSAGYLYAPGVYDLPFSLDRDRFSLIGENRWWVASQHELHSVFRVEFLDEFSTQLSLAGSYVWTSVAGNRSLRATVMTGFKEPSFFALGHPLTGNPDLKLERSVSAEVAWRQELAVAEGGSFEAKLFYNRYKNLVDFDEISFSHVNRDQVEVTGGEVSVDVKLSPVIEAGAAVTYSNGTIKGVDRPLRNRPEWLAGAYVNWAMSDEVNLYCSVSYVDKQYASSFVTGPRLLEDFITVDATLSWQLNEHLRVYAKVNNATDTDYEEAVGFPAQEITARGGVTLAF